ncbi:hypothetical protein [Deinococcus kurensis]|uniref:hypothetical protein n=1 Tax=Deinococcus kurensis TaxID=2662757 RepID=UPI0012D2F691|nr:hypothetical protein [Deinococcus kurensis]
MTATKTHPARLHLPRAAAKSWDDYLAAADGDAEKAGKAARADVVERERQNSAARRFKDAYEPIVKALGLPESVDADDVDATRSRAQQAVTDLQGKSTAGTDAGKKLEAAHAALKKLGIDPEKLTEGVAAAEAKFAQADKASTLEREVAFGKAAQALGFDSAKLARALRDEQGLPTLGKVKVKVTENGTEVEREQDAWGYARQDEQGQATFTPLSEHPDVKGWEASLKAAASGSGPSPDVITTPTLINQPATASGAPALTIQTAVPMGAGTV